ncbi:hypothetical protein BESB_073990 [Besnoitia besnoiti]|uniref:Cilia- and flagella-associated protein 45 n=1 Tax=Besnoitia besnoiti TaxID=94643 RepID=A0A2A9MF30_BESBE|nr:uncharacterized protein BESB_073990 [Besnoitia besnoiti]PFH34247.1 hypothetical protein BESB_073990 [Besnoitia besnoiti]
MPIQVYMTSQPCAKARAKGLRYRKVGDESHVDESLFGTTHKRDVLITGKDNVMALLAEKRSRSYGASSDTIYLPNDELEKMKERRQRMLAKEAERRKKEIEKMNNDDPTLDSIRSKATAAKYEQRDEVKRMNQMILHSKVNTIRDTQIEQKKQWQAEEEAMERKLDLIMDLDRIRGMHQEEEKEQRRQQKLKAQAAMIRTQMAEREARRELELGERERERQLLVNQMEALRLVELQTRRQKEETKRLLMNEINAHNAKSAKEKEERLAKRMEEDLAIAEYQREKAQREKELEDRRREMMAAKERETAALYAKNEKAMDKQAEMDALRARRAMDERDRRERLKVAQERDRLDRINAELAEARKKQHYDKVQTLAQMAVAEREEFDRMARAQRESEEAEKKKAAQEQLKRQQHAEELRKQIEAHEAQKLQRKREHIEEAIRLKKEQEEDKKNLETIKVTKTGEKAKKPNGHPPHTAGAAPRHPILLGTQLHTSLSFR